MNRSLLRYCLLLILLGSAALARAQDPVFTVTNIQHACDGNLNGSIEILITSGDQGSVEVNVFGPPHQTPVASTPTIGVPFLITGLPGGNTSGTSRSYTIIVTDNFGNATSLNNQVFNYPAIAITGESGTDNTDTDCNSPNPDGSVTATVTGGSPFGVTYTWNGPGGPYVTPTPTLSNVAGGTYTLTVTDNNTTCTTVSNPVTINDPFPALKNISPTGTANICPGDDFDVTVQNSEFNANNVNYEILINGAPTGITQIGTGGDIVITVPSASLSDGAIITVRASYSNCTTYAAMTGSATIQIQDLAATASITDNTRCITPFNGAIDLTVTGAIGTLTYAWTGPNAFNAATQDITALEPGSYDVTITDQTTTCFVTENYVVDDTPPTLTLSNATTPNSRCALPFNGAIDLTVGGTATGAFTYVWISTVPGFVDPGTQDLTAVADGDYSVTVTDGPSGCFVASGTITVANNRPPITVIGTATDNTRCVAAFNGAVNITPAGGSGPYTFAWTGPGGFVSASEDITTLAPGTYTVIVTETPSGCASVATDFVVGDNPPTITVSGSVTDNTRCVSAFNGAVNITAAGGTTYTYAWTGPGGFVSAAEDITALQAGTYTVTVTETVSGCTSAPTDFIVGDNSPVITVTGAETENTSCGPGFNGAIDITPAGGTAPYTFAWTGPGGFTASSEDITNLQPGLYTVTVTETLSGCASAPTNFTVNNNPLTITATGTAIENTRCSGPFNGSVDITPAGGTTYTFSWTGPGGFTSASEDISTLAPGTYTVTLTETISGCTSVPTDFVVNDLPPTITVTGSVVDNIRCVSPFSGAVDITPAGGSAYSFAWTGPGGFTATSEDISALAPGTYTVTVTETVTACTSAPTDFVVVDNPPTLSLSNTVTSNTRCQAPFDGAVDLTVNGTATGAFTFVWSSTVPGFLNPGTEDLTAVANGDYTVIVTDGPSGCTITSATISVGDARPVISVTGTTTDNTNCNAPFNGAIDITPAGGSAPYTFAWTGPGGYTAASEDITALDAGTYTVIVTETASGCATAPQIFQVNDVLSVLTLSNSATSNTRCIAPFNGAIDLTVGGTATGPFTYAWSSSIVGFIDPGTEDLTAIADGSYTVIVTDGASGCSVTSAPIAVGNARPAITVSGTVTENTRCVAAFNGAVDITPSGGTGPYTFSWTGPNSFASLSEDISGLEPGTYNVEVTETTSGCVSATTNFVVNDNPPTITVTGNVTDNTRCVAAFNGAIDVTAAGGTAYTYAWTGPNGYVSASEDLTALESGTYTVIVTETASGCSTSPTNFVVDDNPPSITVTGNVNHNTRCVTAFNGEIDITASGGTAYTYAWTGPNSFVSASEDLTALEPGTYSVIVTETVSGCVSASTDFTVNDNPPTLSVTENVSDNTRCVAAFNGAINITVGGTATGPFTFAWTSSLGAFVDPGTEDLTSLEAGDYTLTVTDGPSGCSVTSAAITVGSSTPTISVTGVITDNSRCIAAFNGTINITAAGGSAPYNFSWTGPGGFTAATEDLTALEAGTYTVVVTETNSGCESAPTDFVVADDITLPTASISGGGAVCAGQPLPNVVFNFTGLSDFDFTYTDGSSTVNVNGVTSNSYTINNAAVGTYTITALTDANGCIATSLGAPVSVSVNPIPGDAQNSQGATYCTGDVIPSISVDDPGAGFAINWYDAATGGVQVATGASFQPTGEGTYHAEVVNTTTSCVSAARVPVTLEEFDKAIATLSGTQTICPGDNATISIALTGTGPWDLVYNDGSGDINVNGIASTPHNIVVAPSATTTYTLVSVTNAQCGAGTTGGSAIVTVNTPAGDETTFGSETWIGYVYDDSSLPSPPSSNIDFSTSKYRGFISETDMDNLGLLSSYNAVTDGFNVDLTVLFPMQGPNVCGSYLDDFSVRYKMDKTFAAGVYRFTVGADDGVRLIIDGTNVIPATAFDPQSYTTYTTDPMCLTAGIHSFVIEYFERGSQSRLSFAYVQVETPTTTSPVAVCINSTSPTLTASSTDPAVVDFNWYKGATLVFTGTNYTPLAADLDITAVGATTFTVTSVYNCGESQPATVVVNVVDGATLTMNDPTICESGGVVDLRDFVDEAPTGGSFTFSGHANISGFDFDPSGLAGSTIPITVDYSIGTCSAPQATLNVTVANSAAITAPTTAVAHCEGAGNLDLTTLVTAIPAGGAFVFAGNQVTGNSFDPAGLSGNQTITVDYSIGGCVATQQTFDINVTTTANLITSGTTVCQNGASINLLSLVSATPAGGSFAFSGTGVSGTSFNPVGQSGTISVSVVYDLSGCTANGTINVTVLNPGDPLCTSGGGTGQCATVVIVPEPTPATCTNSDGGIVFNIDPFVPAVNPDGVKITILGISNSNLAISRTNFNDPVFANLPMGSYSYTIEYGEATCIKTGEVTIDQSGTVGTPVATNVVSPQCFGSSTGSITLDVPGETGNVLEWSLDAGITDPFKPFTAGSQITGIPAGPSPSFEQVISVRRDASDPCFASVRVEIQEAMADIDASFDIASATCNGNDGAITGITSTGGNGGYQFSINGGQDFQTNDSFSGLSGGMYTLKVRDASGCEKNFSANVTFPGFINANVSKSNADCTENGNSGVISVAITDPGNYQIALSTDQFNAPPEEEYQNYSNPFVTFSQLASGQYFVYMKSNTTACPTRTAAIDVFGPAQVSFEVQPQCTGTSFSVVLMNLVGAEGTPVQISVYRKFTGEQVETFTVTPIPATGTISLNAADHPFLTMPDEYQIQVVQVDPTAFCEIKSALVDVVVPSPLSVNITNIAESYPDMATGMLTLGNFFGGSDPYYTRIEMDSASSPSLPAHTTDFTEVLPNSNNVFEQEYQGVPPGRYVVQVTDANGCAIEAVVRVPMDQDIFIPNIFTPNDDGSNDVFFIRNLPFGDAGVKLKITSRWGKEVYSSDNYQNDWAAQNAADGIYFYQLQINGATPVTGWVEVLRGQKP